MLNFSENRRNSEKFWQWEQKRYKEIDKDLSIYLSPAMTFSSKQLDLNGLWIPELCDHIFVCKKQRRFPPIAVFVCALMQQTAKTDANLHLDAKLGFTLFWSTYSGMFEKVVMEKTEVFGMN